MSYAYPLSRSETAQSRLVALVEVLAVAGAVAFGAQARFYLPFTPVPITLQTLPVLLAPFAIGRLRATAGMALYMCLGIAGVPLFAAAPGIGATFGYLLGFILAQTVVTRFRNPAAGIAAGLAVIYMAGATWLSLGAHVTPWQPVVMGVVPFLPGAMIKATAAYKLVPLVRR